MYILKLWNLIYFKCKKTNLGMIVCNAFVLVFQIFAFLTGKQPILFHGFWGLPLSIGSAILGLTAAKTIQYKCLLQAHAVMVCRNILRTFTMYFSQCLVSGILLIIPTLMEIIILNSDIGGFQLVMNIFMLGLLK